MACLYDPNLKNFFLSQPSLEPTEHFFLRKACLAFLNTENVVKSSKYSWVDKQIHKAAAWLQKSKYSHVEFAFQFATLNSSKSVWISCGFDRSGRLSLNTRTIPFVESTKSEPSAWDVFNLNMNKEDRCKLFRMCIEDVKRGLDFGFFLMINFLIPISSLQLRFNLNQYSFCSEYTAHRLKEVVNAPEQWQKLEPCSTSPHRLFAFLQNSDSIVPVSFVT